MSYRNARAVNPGKHGPEDWRVEFCRSAPTHDEIVFIVGMLLVAEDRYCSPGELGRNMLWYFLDRVYMANSVAEVLDVAEDCRSAKNAPPRLRRVW